MEAVIHQPLGDVIHIDADITLQRTQVEDALMGHTARSAAEQHRVVGIQSLCQVVGGQQRNGAGLTQSLRTHHPQIHPADRQDAGAAQGRR